MNTMTPTGCRPLREHFQRCPDDDGPQSREQVREMAELVALVEAGFTGNLSIDLRNGVPLMCKRTKTWRFGKLQNGELTEEP